MTLAKRSLLPVCGFLIWWGCWLASVPGTAASLREAGRRYGPTTPNGYYVRVEPSSVTMSHTQHPRVTVTVENAAGQPVDGVPVSFTPSEGRIIAGASRTHSGVVAGTFTAASGSDNPRTAFIIVTVEDIEVTLFIDIVPAVFGR